MVAVRYIVISDDLADDDEISPQGSTLASAAVAVPAAAGEQTLSLLPLRRRRHLPSEAVSNIAGVVFRLSARLDTIAAEASATQTTAVFSVLLRHELRNGGRTEWPREPGHLEERGVAAQQSRASLGTIFNPRQ